MRAGEDLSLRRCRNGQARERGRLGRRGIGPLRRTWPNVAGGERIIAIGIASFYSMDIETADVSNSEEKWIVGEKEVQYVVHRNCLCVRGTLSALCCKK